MWTCVNAGWVNSQLYGKDKDLGNQEYDLHDWGIIYSSAIDESEQFL